jgi:hypothetical protein
LVQAERRESARDPAGGGYPLGFHAWSVNQKNAWFCGFNLGYVKRPRMRASLAGLPF